MAERVGEDEMGVVAQSGGDEWLFAYGAHFFLYLTLFIGLFDEDWAAEKGPLSYQREWARRLGPWIGKDYPSVAL